MAMAAGNCDLYSLLLVTLLQAVPSVSEGEVSSLQHTAEVPIPQTKMKNWRHTSIENVLSLG